MDRCIGCHACEIHCKTEHDIPAGPKLCKIIEAGPKSVEGFPRIQFVFASCFHCENPLCAEVCPTDAIQVRAKDEIVYIDPELCIGCQACINACLSGNPQWDSISGKALKCDLCRERLDEGMQPACVTGCTTQALSLGLMDDFGYVNC